MDKEKQLSSGSSSNSQENWEKKIDVTYDRDNPPPKTRGEKIFNALSWGFFGWIVNAAVSIKLADLATYRFRPFFVKNSARLAETGLFKHMFKDDHERKTLAQTFFTVVALLPGGFSVLAPIKWMEDRKTNIVTGLDNLIGPHNPSENEKKQIEARHEYIEHAPKIGWWDLIKGRFLPIVAVLSTHLSFANYPTNIPNSIAKLFGSDKSFQGLNAIYNNMGSKIYSMLSNTKKFGMKNLFAKAENALDKSIVTYIENAKIEHRPYYNLTSDGLTFGYSPSSNSTARFTGKDRMKEYVGNSVIDFGYSAGVAFWTFVASHFFAFKDEVKRENKLQNQQPSQNAEPRRFQLETSPLEPMPNHLGHHKTPLTQIESAQYADKVMQPNVMSEHRA